MSDRPDQVSEFETASQTPRTGLIRELTDFLKQNKKWWLAPIVLVMVLISILIIYGGGTTPFLYVFF